MILGCPGRSVHFCRNIKSDLRERRLRSLKCFILFKYPLRLFVLVDSLLIIVMRRILFIPSLVKIMDLPVVILPCGGQAVTAVGDPAVLVLKTLPLLLLGQDFLAPLTLLNLGLRAA